MITYPYCIIVISVFSCSSRACSRQQHGRPAPPKRFAAASKTAVHCPISYTESCRLSIHFSDAILYPNRLGFGIVGADMIDDLTTRLGEAMPEQPGCSIGEIIAFEL